MSRNELAVTIAGLIATFLLPWPQGEEAPERPQATMMAKGAHARPQIAAYDIFGRVRTGPTEGIQPTR